MMDQAALGVLQPAGAVHEVADPYDVAIVDDEPTIADFLAAILDDLPNVATRTFHNPMDLLAELPDRCPDLVITDNQMPQLSGIELTERLRNHPRCPPIPIVMVTVDANRDVQSRALNAGVSDFLRKPLDVLEARIRVRNMLALREGQRSAERQADWLRSEVALATAEVVAREEETILSLARAVEFRDWETGSHIVRMAHYCRVIAEELDREEAHPQMLFKAATLHDVGKIGVPDHILLKPGNLTPDEVAVMQRHAEIGHEILADCHGEILARASEIAWTHHERFDGRGYPRGLAGDEIPLAGRIVAVADVFDALCSKRPYKRAWILDEAFDYVRGESGAQFDPACVDALLRREGDIRRIAADNPG